MEKLEEKLNDEREKAHFIREKVIEQEKTSVELNQDFQTRCIPALKPIFDKILVEKQSRNARRTTNGHLSESSEDRINKIRDLLKRGEFETLADYIVRLDVVNDEKRKSMPISEQVLYFIVLLNTYLFDDFVSILTKVKIAVQLLIMIWFQTSELEKQDALVGFLQDTLEFSKIMATAVPVLEQMLMSTTVSDVFETIEFFKTGYLFNIKGTEAGMRLMLRLLHINTGSDKNEKGEAVIKAYHAVLFGTDTNGRYVQYIGNFLFKFVLI